MSKDHPPRSALLEQVVANHHDYVWARLPFLVPMALKVARRRGDATSAELARLLTKFEPLLLGHLDREERMLGAPDAAAVASWVSEGMHADHLAVETLLTCIREVAGNGYRASELAGPTEHALYDELARLDEHVRSQVALEEHLIAWRLGAKGAS